MSGSVLDAYGDSDDSILQHIVCFPVSRGTMINFVGFVSHPEKEGTIWESKMVEQRTHEDLAAAYQGWEPEVEQLVKVRVLRRFLVSILNTYAVH